MPEKVLFEDSSRISFLQSTSVSEGRPWIYDPQCDEPLNEYLETLMVQMTPSGYLKWLCNQYGANVDSIPSTEHECRRTCRKVVRMLPDFDGERFIQ